MKNNKKFLSILLVVALCVTMVFSLIACTPKTPDEKDPVSDEGKYISNGNFENISSEEGIFPMTPSSWSNSAGSTSSDNETPVDSKSLVSGVIDTNDDIYNSNKKDWDRLGNPGAIGADPNILMIYNRKSNSYKYTSNSFSLDANKYFKVQVSVRTDNVEGSGGYVSIGGDTLVEFENIDTKGEWITYTAMLQTSNIASNSLTITASNGRLGKNDGSLSQGYMFIDNVVVTEATADQYNTSTDDSNANRKASLLYGDASFENISGAENPYSTKKWSGVSSVGEDGETAPTGSDHLERGVVDTNSTTALPDSANNITAMENFDTRFLMIDNKKPTAYGYRSDSKIRFTASDKSLYKLSFWIRTEGVEAGKGAYIKVASSTSKDEDPIIEYNNINTDGKWAQVSVYLQPDTLRYKDLYVEVGLGTGGKNDKDLLVKGTAFFDEMTLETIDSLPDGITTGSDNYGTVKADPIEEVLTHQYDEKSYSHAEYDKDSGITDRGTFKTLDITDPSTWDTSYGAFPNAPNDKITTLMGFNNANPTITSFKYTPELVNDKSELTLQQKHYYRLSMWVKTDIVNKNAGLNIQLYKKAEDSSKEDELLTAVDGFNTKKLSEDAQATYNGYTEIAFLIESDIVESNDIYFQFQLGSGTQFTGASHVEGSAYIAGISMSTIKFADYNSESGDYVKKHSFRTSGGTIANGEFNNIDIANTEKNYNKINEEAKIEFKEKDFLDQNTAGVFGLPKDWTFTSSDELKHLNAGVLDVKNTAQLASLGYPADFDIFKNLPEYEKKDNTNVLAIHNNSEIVTEDGEEARKTWGFTSPSISLTKNTFYEISVYAYVKDGNASINLKNSSKSVISNFELGVTDGWQEFKFFVETGFDDFTSYLELAIGPNTTNLKDNSVLFDLPKITKISEESYEKGVDIANDEASLVNYNAITFTTTNFDNYTATEEDFTFSTPANWSGSHADSDAPNGKHKSIAGIFTQGHSNRNWLGGDDTSDPNNVIDDSTLTDIIESVPNINGQGTEGATNNNILVINNHEASEYKFSTTLANNSLVEESYYEISIMIRTYQLSEGNTAKIQLKLHNDIFEFSLNEDRGISVNHDSWKKYSFYIRTGKDATIDDVELSIQLGSKGKDNYVSGYLFADNITINKITEEIYDAKAPEAAFTEGAYNTAITSNTHRVFFEKDDLRTPDPEPESEADPLLWLYISSGILGVLLIIAMIVVFFKKFKLIEKMFPKKDINKKGSESYNRNNVDANKSSTFTKDVNKPDRE